MGDKAFWLKHMLAHPEDTERKIAEGWYDKPYISYAMWANMSDEEKASFTPEKQKQYHFLNSGVEVQRQALPEFKVQIAHRREVEKAREEQGFAKAREEAMAKSVVDFSQVFGAGVKEERERLDALDATGLGTHHAVGEKHPKAKINDAIAQQLRREYWASDRNRGDVKAMQAKYGISRGTLRAVIERATWVHLPRVEGEPEENLKRLSKSEVRVAKKAKEEGVEPVRNKLGRLALPADVVTKLRAEKIAKSLATKAKKNSPAGE
jgi:hypothetical protein